MTDLSCSRYNRPNTFRCCLSKQRITIFPNCTSHDTRVKLTCSIYAAFNRSSKNIGSSAAPEYNINCCLLHFLLVIFGSSKLLAQLYCSIKLGSTVSQSTRRRSDWERTAERRIWASAAGENRVQSQKMVTSLLCQSSLHHINVKSQGQPQFQECWDIV